MAASKSFCGSSGAEREREGRRRQEDFLPRLVGLCDHHVDSVDDDDNHVDRDVDDHHHHVDRVDDDVDDNIFCAGTPGLRRRSGPDLTHQTW